MRSVNEITNILAATNDDVVGVECTIVYSKRYTFKALKDQKVEEGDIWLTVLNSGKLTPVTVVKVHEEFEYKESEMRYCWLFQKVDYSKLKTILDEEEELVERVRRQMRKSLQR